MCGEASILEKEFHRTKDGKHDVSHKVPKITSPQLDGISLGTQSVPALVSVLSVPSEGWPEASCANMEPTVC